MPAHSDERPYRAWARLMTLSLVTMGGAEGLAQSVGDGLTETRWTGGGILSNDYRNGANWVGRRVGDRFDEVAIFGAETTVLRNPNVSFPTELGAIEFRQNGASPSTAFAFGGLGRLTVDKGIENRNAANQVFNLPVEIARQGVGVRSAPVVTNRADGEHFGLITFNNRVDITRDGVRIDQGNAGIAFNGPVTGSWFEVLGTGTVTMRGRTDVDGLDIESGRVFVRDNGRLADTTTVDIGADGQLRLIGITDAINELRGDGEVRLESGANLVVGNYAGFNSVGRGSYRGSITGNGRLTKRGTTGFLRISGDNTYTGGTLVEEGTLEVSGSGHATGTGPTTVAAGARLEGSAALTNVLTVQAMGALAPGFRSLPRRLRLNDLVLNDGARVEFDLEKRLDGLSLQDSLTLEGHASLDGDLFLSISGSQHLVEGERFTLIESLNGNDLVGGFDSVEVNGLVPGVLVDLDRQDTRVDLVVTQANAEFLAGDFNDDGVVDGADYTVWRDTRFGDSAALNGNGFGRSFVVEDDLELWRDNFGASETSAASSGVPEPRSLLSVVLLMFANSFRRGLMR